MVQLINTAADRGDSLGGIFEVIALGVPIGLGSYIQWDKRLNGRLAQAVMSIQAIKGVEIGSGVSMARCFGSEIMDEIFRKKQGAENKTQTGMGNFHRGSNHAGGIEGGVTNGLPIIVRAAMKPIPTLKKPLHSVDIITRKPVEAAYERSDTCAVPAASVIGEAMVALVLADAMLEKFGGDHMNETKKNFTSYIKHVLSF
jgi:chorismate synthase